MTFTVQELELALKSDGNLFNGKKNDAYANIIEMLWWDCPATGILDVLGIGEFRIADSAFGKDGPLISLQGESIWENYIILERDGRFFKLSGEYNSWESYPWDGKVKEVKRVVVEKVVWE